MTIGFMHPQDFFIDAYKVWDFIFAHTAIAAEVFCTVGLFIYLRITPFAIKHYKRFTTDRTAMRYTSDIDHNIHLTYKVLCLEKIVLPGEPGS